MHKYFQTVCLVSHRAAVLPNSFIYWYSWAVTHVPSPRYTAKSSVCKPTPAFHDDFFIPLAAATAQQLLLNLITAADIVQNVAQQHAMKLQFEQGKTEAVVHIRGKGKKEALAFLADNMPGEESSCIARLPLACGQCLRIVPSYLHLGTMATMSPNSAQDLAHRKNAAAAAEKGAVCKTVGGKAHPFQVKETGHYCHPCIFALCSGNMGNSDDATDGGIFCCLRVPSQTSSWRGMVP